MNARWRYMAVGVLLVVAIVCTGVSQFVVRTYAAPDETTYGWTRTLDGDPSSNPAIQPRNLVVGPDDSVYHWGTFLGTVDFDPQGSGDTKVSANGSDDVFITKHNADGSYGWTRTISGDDYNEGLVDVAIAPDGSVHAAGRIETGSDVDFDPQGSGHTYTPVGDTDGFIAKWNASGTFQWVRTMSGLSANVFASDHLTINSTGSVYLAGAFTDTIDFDVDGTGDTYTAESGMFITKHNADGSYAWTKSYGEPVYADGSSSPDYMTIGPDDSLYLAGVFGGTIDFNPGGAPDDRTAAGFQNFVTKLNPDDSYAWTRLISDAPVSVNKMLVAPDDSVYLQGHFVDPGTIDFDPDGPGDPHTAVAAADVFVLKTAANGTHDWTRTITVDDFSSFVEATDIVLDSDDAMYVTGAIYGTVDFDTSDQQIATGSLAYLTKFDADGSYQGTQLYGSGDPAEGALATAMVIDSNDNIYILGDFVGTVDFDPGPGVDQKTAPDNGAYIVKFAAAANYDGVTAWVGDMVISSYGMVIDSEDSIYATGNFVGTVDFDPDGAGDVHTTAPDLSVFDIFLTKMAANPSSPGSGGGGSGGGSGGGAGSQSGSGSSGTHGSPLQSSEDSSAVVPEVPDVVTDDLAAPNAPSGSGASPSGNSGADGPTSIDRVLQIIARFIRDLPPAVLYSFPYWLFALLALLALILFVQGLREAAEVNSVEKQLHRDQLLNTQKATFVQLASHYLRTPATLIKGAPDLALSLHEGQPEAWRAVAQQATELAKTAEELIARISQSPTASVPHVGGNAASVRLWRQPSFVVPIALVALITLVANILALAVAHLSLSVLNIIGQIVVFAIVVAVLYAVFRARVLRRQRLERLVAARAQEAAIDRGRNDLIKQSVDLFAPYLAAMRQQRQQLGMGKAAPLLDDGCQRFERMLARFRLAMQLGASSPMIQPTEVSLKPLLDKAVAASQAKASAKRVTIQYPSSHDLVTTGPNWLTYALASVIDNAVDYSPEGSTVKISANANAIAIQDNGPGIQKDALGMLLQPFSRAEDVLNFTHQGMGFSLYLDKLIMTHLGGSIAVDSSPHHGTTVTLVTGA